MVYTLEYSFYKDNPEIFCQSMWIPDTNFNQIRSGRNNFQVFQEIVKKAGMDQNQIAWAEQVHGCEIKNVNSAGLFKNCDGLITSDSKIGLAIRTADCAAVMVYDPVQKVIANFHVGWRGARLGIISRGIQNLQEKYYSKPQDLLISISPFIRACCYRVGPEFHQYFAPKYIRHYQGFLYLDLRKIILDQLLIAGCEKTQIDWCDHCVFCHSDGYPSFRRTKTFNRIIHIIKREE